jgi:hypothetical protein
MKHAVGSRVAGVTKKEKPEAAYCIESSYETEVRYCIKRGMSW